VSVAWARVTGSPLPGQSDHPAAGSNWATIVKVTIPDDASGFAHREELVYLPPAWYASTPPPRLPVVMMIGGEFSQPADWLYAGNAQQTTAAFAATHGGNAPVLVFPDYDGAFSNDTECVNGPRGNAADHLTKDVVPYMISHFSVGADPTNWGVVGWSSGRTCALTLSVTHPELFSAFVDIDGGLGPNAGTERQTIERLFGGDTDAWTAFDPRTVLAEHGHYENMSGWFSSSADTPTVYRPPSTEPLPSQDPGWGANFDDHAAIVDEMCRMASGHGIECAVVPNPGRHDFSSAASAFAASLPWLAGRLGTPRAPAIPLPAAPPPP
jgi:S-formylglutathione hydrolase FrmB